MTKVLHCFSDRIPNWVFTKVFLGFSDIISDYKFSDIISDHKSAQILRGFEYFT